MDDDENFSITIDVSQFAPEELKVNIDDGQLIIEGSHDAKNDQYGQVHTPFQSQPITYIINLNIRRLKQMRCVRHPSLIARKNQLETANSASLRFLKHLKLDAFEKLQLLFFFVVRS